MWAYFIWLQLFLMHDTNTQKKTKNFCASWKMNVIKGQSNENRIFYSFRICLGGCLTILWDILVLVFCVICMLKWSQRGFFGAFVQFLILKLLIYWNEWRSLNLCSFYWDFNFFCISLNFFKMLKQF